MIEKQIDTPDVNTKLKKKHQVRRYIWKHKFVFLLLLIIFVGSAWTEIKIYLMTKDATLQKTRLEQTLNIKIDSIKNANLLEISKVFSWSIRIEMMRDNLEQVDQLFFAFVKEPNIENVKLINPTSQLILKSTNQKEIGQAFPNAVLLMKDEPAIFKQNNVATIVIPIMGLNTKLGVLVITGK